MNESLKEAIAETQAEVFTMSREYNLDSGLSSGFL